MGAPSVSLGVCFRRTLKALLPPFVVAALRRLRSPPAAATTGATSTVQAGELPHWEMVPDSDAVWAAGEGWAHPSIVETQRNKWDEFVRSVRRPYPFGRSHEGDVTSPPDIASHNTILTFGYVLSRVAEGRASMSVLDWGGGLGHYYVYARELLPSVRFEYVIKDLEGLCAKGRQLLPDATFETDADAALSRRYDLVLASSSVHYTRDHYGLIDRLCDAAAGWLMITRTPMVERHDDFVVVQRPHIYGYMTEYPGWFINRTRLVDHVTGRGFTLEREFAVGEAAHVPNAPENGQYAGFLFRRSVAQTTPLAPSVP